MRKALKRIKKRNERKTQEGCNVNKFAKLNNYEFDSNQNENRTEVTIEPICDEIDECEVLQNLLRCFITK